MNVFFDVLIRIAVFPLLFLVAVLPSAAQTWTVQSSGSQGNIWEVDFLDENNGIAAVWITPGSAEILRTTNGGATWQTPFSEINQGMTGAAFLSQNRACVVGGTTNFARVFNSTDGGATWEMVVDKADAKPAFWCVAFGDENTGFAGGGSGLLYRTTNSGSDWFGLPGQIGQGQVIDLFFLNTTNGYAILTESSSVNDFIYGATLHHTTDGGLNWTKVSEGFGLRTVYFVDENVGYMGGTSGSKPTIWKTTDGGENWKAIGTGPGGSQVFVNDIQFMEDNPYVGYAVGGDVLSDRDGFILSTTDGGLTWTEEEKGLPDGLRSVEFPSQKVGFVVGDRGRVMKTTREVIAPPAPTAALSRMTVDLGDVGVGSSSTAALYIKSANIAGLEVAAIAFKDPDAAAAAGFSVQPADALPMNWTGIDSLQVEIGFAPQALGQAEATLVIETNDQAQTTLEVAVAAAGVEGVQPALKLSTSMIDFGAVAVGGSAEEELELSPANSAGLEITGVQVDPSGGAFTVSTGASFPVTLMEGQSITVTVAFAPGTAGAASANLIVASSDAASAETNVALSGEGVQPSVSVNVESVDFGTVDVGSSNQKSVEISAGGDVPLEVASVEFGTSNAGDLGFSLSLDRQTPVTLAPGETLTAGITFMPTMSGAVATELSIMTNDPAQGTLAVPVTGIASSDIGGVDEERAARQLRAVPNPVGDRLHVTGTDVGHGTVQVRLIDISGTVVYHGKERAEGGSYQLLIDTAELPSGTYLVEIEMQGLRRSTVVVKQ